MLRKVRAHHCSGRRRERAHAVRIHSHQGPNAVGLSQHELLLCEHAEMARDRRLALVELLDDLSDGDRSISRGDHMEDSQARAVSKTSEPRCVLVGVRRGERIHASSTINDESTRRNLHADVLTVAVVGNQVATGMSPNV